MSPLLTSRPSVAVVNRLLAACVVMAAIAAGLALGNPGDARPSAAVPTFYAAGLLCAGMVAYLLVVAARIVEDAACVDGGRRHGGGRGARAEPGFASSR